MARPASLLARALIAALIAGIAARGVAQESGPALRDRYALSARLDPARREIHAHATIRWRNRTRGALSALFLHLYPNAFASQGTVFMREHGPRNVPLSRTGGIDLSRFQTGDGLDLLAHSDRDLVPGDATQLRVDLPQPLVAGAWLTLEIDFTVRLPSITARMGADRDFFMVAQWFPKLARVSESGEFHSFPYHGLGEFDADFADYALEVSVPEEYVVAAPGERVTREAHAGRRVERYRLDNALDIAWAAYPRFVVSTRQTPRARVDVYAAPGAVALAAREAALLDEGLARLSARLGPYPYRRLVLVLPPRFAIGAAGMEYPGLIVGWVVDPRTGPRNPIAELVHDDVTAHELCHQWFPITITSDELETPMLDEGLAQWLGLDLLRARYGRDFFARALGLPIDMFEIVRVRSRDRGSSLRPAYRYDARQLGALVYGQSALVLETIRRSFGPHKLDAALADYARQNRFAHASFDALEASFDRSYGAGFGERVLRRGLEGRPVEWPGSAATDDARARVIEAPSGSRRPGARSLYARVLFMVEALLGVFGP